jgi:hypothetical protein
LPAPSIGGWGGGASEPTPLAERWPWELHIKPGAEPARHWNLPEAAGDPLFGLPALPRLDLPESPFRHLSWFDREHAEVFFGRAFQVRELYDRVTAPDAPPILLFYGQSGVGKSSVLAAGLLPRLEARHRVHYLRRAPALGLHGTLMQPLGAGAGGPGAAWRQAETDAQAPLLLILRPRRRRSSPGQRPIPLRSSAPCLPRCRTSSASRTHDPAAV